MRDLLIALAVIIGGMSVVGYFETADAQAVAEWRESNLPQLAKE